MARASLMPSVAVGARWAWSSSPCAERPECLDCIYCNLMQSYAYLTAKLIHRTPRHYPPRTAKAPLSSRINTAGRMLVSPRQTYAFLVSAELLLCLPPDPPRQDEFRHLRHRARRRWPRRGYHTSPPTCHLDGRATGHHTIEVPADGAAVGSPFSFKFSDTTRNPGDNSYLQLSFYNLTNRYVLTTAPFSAADYTTATASVSVPSEIEDGGYALVVQELDGSSQLYEYDHGVQFTR